MACTLIFASIHPEVLENSIQTCPAGKTGNKDIVIDVTVKGDALKLETCGDIVFVQKKFTKGNILGKNIGYSLVSASEMHP